MWRILKIVIFNIRLIVAVIMDFFTEKRVKKAFAGRISTTELVNRIFNFCEVYSGKVMYPYQAQFSKRIIRSVLENDGAELTALFARQSGKCFEKGTEILMSDGTVKKVEDIVVGDYVMSPNSKPVRVTALGRGREDMFEVRSREKNHESFVVNKSHILSLVDRKGNIVNMSVEDYLKEPEWKKKDYYRGYRVAVEYPHKEVGIEPYFLGLWLGDGSSHDVKITNIDKEVIDYLHDYAERLGMQVSVYKEEGKINDYAITNTNHNKHKRFHYNPIREFLKKNNLFGNKHIPQKCLSNSREFRLELLAGLIDSDGYRSEQKGKENVMTISLSNKRLADDVLRLIRSLGFRANMKTKTTKLNGKEFVCYPISAYGDFTEVPTKIPRKQWKSCNLRENPLTFGFDLIPKGVDDYYGFTIDSEDHLFLLGDYTVTHNTETVSITCGGLMIILPQLANMPMFLEDPRLQMFKDGFWIGIFAPSQRQAQTTYNRMKSRLQCKEAIAVLNDPDFRLEFTTSNGQTVALSNGSFCTAISASDGANIEGESFKFIICEECQDISNYKIQKCLTGDTRVLLDDGSYERIDTIVEQGNKGKEFNVVCFDNTMSWKTTKVPLEYYDNGVQDVYEIALDNGSTIKATLNHQFYTLNKKTRGTKCKFRTVQEILDSMDKDRPLRIGVPERLPYFAESKSLDYEKGLIIGYMMGDGCMVGTPKFIGDIPTCERLHELIQLVVGNEVNMTEYNYNKNNGMCEVCFSTPTNKKGSNTFVSFLKDFGVYGLVKDKKCLPDKVYSQEFYRGYIEGLIETDGSVENCHVKPIISFANVSEKMVDQLKDIYLKFGIHATKFVRDNSKGFGGDNALPIYLLHVKSVKDIRNFADNIVLFRKQVFLNDSLDAIEDRNSREESKYYPDEMRFCKVKSIKYVGKEHTYCLKVEGRNFIANNMISSNSIHPMGASYNATICKIGTATTYKGDFYNAIQRNKEEYKSKKTKIRNHFEYNYKVVMKYNPRYEKYIEREKRSLGENSDAFRMSYNLEWIISRGMFVDINQFEKECGDDYLDRVMEDHTCTHVAGIDVGGGSSKSKKDADSTVVTIVEVDWDNPVLMETTIDEETGEDITYLAYNTYIKDWLKIEPEVAEDYEEQYHMIMDYLKNFKLARIVVDATREASLGQRIRANVRCEVWLFTFNTRSKSDIYKHLQTEIKTGRARFPNSDAVKETSEYKDFMHEMADLQKGYSGSNLVVAHPDERGAHDDFPDSWCLAVWGTKDAGQIDTTETLRRNEVLNAHRGNSVFRSRNRRTARRR